MNDRESENCTFKRKMQMSRVCAWCVVCVDSSDDDDDDECDIRKHSDSETNYIAARKLNQNNYGRDVKSHKDSQDKKWQREMRADGGGYAVANQRRNDGAPSGPTFSVEIIKKHSSLRICRNLTILQCGFHAEYFRSSRFEWRKKYVQSRSVDGVEMICKLKLKTECVMQSLLLVHD